MKHLRKVSVLVLGASLASILLTGCETPGESALAGAATGGVMGGLLKGDSRNVARGAAIGAVGGYALGKYGESERQRGYIDAQGTSFSPQYYFAPAPQVYYTPPPPAYHHHHYHQSLPYGRYSSRRGYVYSPYSGLMIYVGGIPRGSRVVDPNTGGTFLVP